MDMKKTAFFFSLRLTGFRNREGVCLLRGPNCIYIQLSFAFVFKGLIHAGKYLKFVHLSRVTSANNIARIIV